MPGRARLYIDSAQVASAAASGAVATTAENSGNSLGGDVDQVAVWNRAVSATEISSRYGIGKQ